MFSPCRSVQNKVSNRIHNIDTALEMASSCVFPSPMIVTANKGALKEAGMTRDPADSSGLLNLCMPSLLHPPFGEQGNVWPGA